MATMPPGLQTRSRHGAEHGEHDVKAAIGKRKLFGVAFFETHVQMFGGGPLPGLGKKIRSDIDPGDGGASAGRWNCGIAGAARYVEKAAAGPDRNAAHKVFGRLRGEGRDPAEVARHPTGLQVGLQLREIKGGGWHQNDHDLDLVVRPAVIRPGSQICLDACGSGTVSTHRRRLAPL
jgi:hypothetical protein